MGKRKGIVDTEALLEGRLDKCLEGRLDKCLEGYGGRDAYNDLQLKQVREGLNNDLDLTMVELYANPMHTSRVMKVLREAVEYGCSRNDLELFILHTYPYRTLSEKQHIKRKLDNMIPYSEVLLNIDRNVYDETHLGLYCIARARGLTEMERSLVMHPCLSVRLAEQLLHYFERGNSLEDLKALYEEPKPLWLV